MGVDGPSAEFAEQTYPPLPAGRSVVSTQEYEALLRKAQDDHALMQNRIDNQTAIIDRLGKANAALRKQASECPTCQVIP